MLCVSFVDAQFECRYARKYLDLLQKPRYCVMNRTQNIALFEPWLWARVDGVERDEKGDGFYINRRIFWGIIYTSWMFLQDVKRSITNSRDVILTIQHLWKEVRRESKRTNDGNQEKDEFFARNWENDFRLASIWVLATSHAGTTHAGTIHASST